VTDNKRKAGFDRLSPLFAGRDDLLTLCAPLAPLTFTIEEAVGTIAVQDIFPSRSMPPDAIALRDGYAVASFETLGASPYTPILKLEPPKWVESGEALPQGMDAVLAPHAVQTESLPVEILKQAAPGESVRGQGSDFDKDIALLRQGCRIEALHLPLLKAAGLTHIEVFQPRVQIFIRDDCAENDISGAYLKALAEQCGAKAEIVSAPMNDATAFAKGLSASKADLVLCLGATGLGENDHSAKALHQAGVLLHHGIAFQPAETAGCGYVSKGETSFPVILAPGRFESAFSIWLALVRPLLSHLTQREPKRETLPLARKITSDPGIADLVLLHRSATDTGLCWEPLATGDIPWSAIAKAQAFHILPPDSEGYAVGEMLCVELL